MELLVVLDGVIIFGKGQIKKINKTYSHFGGAGFAINGIDFMKSNGGKNMEIIHYKMFYIMDHHQAIIKAMEGYY